mmetsp:Transcript_37569/g.64025  ORF Transcript_37569/g.64025 Transcript_37569/m.64025 type:complete len:210 (-) Transcript_37569:808-1437(-)
MNFTSIPSKEINHLFCKWEHLSKARIVKVPFMLVQANGGIGLAILSRGREAVYPSFGVDVGCDKFGIGCGCCQCSLFRFVVLFSFIIVSIVRIFVIRYDVCTIFSFLFVFLCHIFPLLFFNLFPVILIAIHDTTFIFIFIFILILFPLLLLLLLFCQLTTIHLHGPIPHHIHHGNTRLTLNITTTLWHIRIGTAARRSNEGIIDTVIYK